MSIGSGYQNASLDGMVNAWPATGARWALFAGDPQNGGTELTGGGYTAPSFAPSNFAAASGNSKTPAAAISFGTSTGAYSDVGDYWAIVDGSGAVVYSDDLPSSQQVSVTASGVPVTIQPSIFFQAGN